MHLRRRLLLIATHLGCLDLVRFSQARLDEGLKFGEHLHSAANVEFSEDDLIVAFVPFIVHEVLPVGQRHSSVTQCFKEDYIPACVSEHNTHMVFKKILARSLTIVTCLHELVQPGIKVPSLKKQKVSAICREVEAVQRDPLYPPKLTNLSHPFRQVQQVSSHAHINMILDLIDPTFNSSEVNCFIL